MGVVEGSESSEELRNTTLMEKRRGKSISKHHNN